MSATQCAVDRRRVADGAIICRSCTQQLEHELDQVPDVVADLLVTYARADRTQSAARRGAASTPLMFDPEASRDLAILRERLGSWARYLAAQLDVAPPGGDTAPAHAAWLRTHTPEIRRHDDAGELHRDVRAAVRAARGATDSDGVSSQFVVGPCPQLVSIGPGVGWCDGDVVATVSTRPDEPSSMTCLSCGHVDGAADWATAGGRIKRRAAETGWTPTYRRSREPTT